MSRCAPGPGRMVRRAALQAPLLRADLQTCFQRSRLAAATDSDLGGSTSTLGAARDTDQVPKRGSEMARRYSPSASKDVEREMRKFKRGTLKSGKGGKGGKVKSRRQAIAIGLSEARREGKRVPAKPASRSSKSSRSSTARKGARSKKGRKQS